MTDSLQQAVGGLVLVWSLPLQLLLAALVRLDSSGPVLFRAQRIGVGGTPFQCLKLRTMTHQPQAAGLAITTEGDARVTRFGRFLRRYRLDELPQLWNVAQGEMRLIGPRPEDPRFVDLEDPLHRRVFTARPGITGPTQLLYVDEAAIIDPVDPERHYREEILPAKVRLDAAYLDRRSLSLDLWILGQTIATILGRGPTPEVVRSRLGL
jgi:lipopolysaccharide/colanic/teichoic acid biosynthesis glycosyltransferase